MTSKRVSARRRTPQRAWKKVFLATLAEGATITAAAAAAGVARRTVYDAKEEDATFAAAWADAYEQGTDVLVDEARRRAAQGVTKPLLYKGVVVETVQEYSDTLMLALLKARRPAEYRERMDVQHSGQIARPSAEELAANRAAGLDDAMEAALANVASLDAARARKAS